MAQTWRQHCAPIIHSVLKETEGLTEKEIKAALLNAYPYGQRSMHPYKIWCDEIKRQRKKVSKTLRNPNQTELF